MVREYDKVVLTDGLTLIDNSRSQACGEDNIVEVKCFETEIDGVDGWAN
jgi:hypothetical protein